MPTSHDAVSPNAAVDELLQTLPRNRIRLDAEIGERHYSDWTRMDPQRPRAVLLPRSTEEVSVMLAICHRHRQPVVPQGGLTGLVGGAHATSHEIALSLERMDQIESIDTAGSCMTVQAGATLESIQKAAVAAGLLCGIDIGARGSCTIGGNVATNAGGNRVIRYGMARDNVLGLEAVLADGTVISSLNTMIKNNSGYDLKHLFVGSEGTLGIITRVVLRLQPLPSTSQCAFLGLPSLEAALAVLQQARAALGGSLSAFEVMWPGFYDFIVDIPAVRRPLAGQHGLYLLIEAFGSDEASDAVRFEDLLASLLEQGLVEDAALAQSIDDSLSFWHLRDAVAEFPLLIPKRSTFDVSFPLASMQEAVARIDADVTARWPDSTRLYFGHLGDNNIHIVVDVPGTAGRFSAEIEDMVYQVVQSLNGAVSAEHGIGRKKRAHLGVSRGPQEIALMRTLKAALDPCGILNPDKVI